jgi:starch synthase (maltosyl-transferring)
MVSTSCRFENGHHCDGLTDRERNTMISDGKRRVVIENVKPEIDGGRFPIKRVIGEKVNVRADIFADGHDVLSAVLCYRRDAKAQWTEVPMRFLNNDRWCGEFVVTEMGKWQYTIRAWVDRFKTWRQFVKKKIKAGRDVSVDVLVGIQLLEATIPRASKTDGKKLEQWAKALRSGIETVRKVELTLNENLDRVMAKYPERQNATSYDKELTIVVDRPNARFSAWYEMFPRSCSDDPGRHGTFQDCEHRLPYIAEMGFDVLYLPPIHPIGHTHRKGKNNVNTAGPDDPGSPWAIGSEEGGHKTIHSKLGTLEDFHRLIKKAGEHGLEIALDLAFQCTPDHPYVKEHPEWFSSKPDGTIQYAENPPKKYEDIYPINFETKNWQELWEELKSIALYWVKQGVRIFRVDNPHTKPFAFWEWLIGEVKGDYPDVIFLSEAFTRPKVMFQLAKLGFTQSYTYFSWRNTKQELTDYFTELTQTEVREYFRPNLWPNTPDILHEFLQSGGRPAFMTRLVLAATLGSSYGIYGPAFELCESSPREQGSEEYLNSEKYEIKLWDITKPDSLKEFIATVNRIRREHPALQGNQNLHFHHIDNENLLCYSKQTEDRSNTILIVVNLHHRYVHSGWVDLDLGALSLDPKQPYQVQDLLNGNRYLWSSPRNYVELHPDICPAHIFLLRRHVRSEHDFDYYE